jgi:glutamine amidotransferase
MLAIIDYGSGNLRSAAKAFERVGAGVTVTQNPKDIARADRIVLPGVGAFADCMHGLSAIPGMLDTLQEEVLGRKKIFLGICVGMQMLFEEGHEHGVHKGLGWLKGSVVALAPKEKLKIPHMGWNDVQITRDHPLLSGIKTGAQAYFVHSYHAQAHAADIIAATQYGQSIAAVVGQGNIFGTQFHPEKSQATGLALLKNFVEM